MVNKPKSSTIKDLYPDLSPEELQESAENRQRYIELVWRMHNRLKREGKLGEVYKNYANYRIKN